MIHPLIRFWTPETIRMARDKKGWSQERLAQEIDVRAATIIQWERGLKLPSREMSRRLRFALLGIVQGIGRARIIWFEEMDDCIRDWRQLGRSWRLIADKVGVSTSVVLVRARELGIDTRDRQGFPPRRRQDRPISEGLRVG